MKRVTIAFCTTLLFFSCNNENSAGQNKTATGETDKKIEAHLDPQAFSTPGEMHQWLASFNGTWDAEIIAFMDPSKPDTSKATQTYSMILNGLFQEAKLSGSMMGMPFEGQSVGGYDNAKKKFVMTWIDNVSSGATHMTGDYDAATKTLNLKGTQTNPSTGDDMGIREVLKVIDDNTYTLEMYGDGPDGNEIKFMEGTFKRRS